MEGAGGREARHIEAERKGAARIQRQAQGEIQVLPGDQADQTPSTLAQVGVQCREGEANYEVESTAQGGQQTGKQ